MSAEQEVWLDIPGFAGAYAASNLGRIKNIRSGRCLSPVEDVYGYLRITLSAKGVKKSAKVHVEVLSAFCGRAPFSGAHAAHNDGDKLNCKLSNLRWATPVENQADIDRHGRRCRGEDVFGAVLTAKDIPMIRAMISGGSRNRFIAEKFGVSISTVHLIRHRKVWAHVE